MCEVVLAENRPIRSSFCSSYSCSVTVGEKRNCRGGGRKGRMGRSGEWLGSSLQISLGGQLLAVTTPISIATIRFTSHTPSYFTPPHCHTTHHNPHKNTLPHVTLHTHNHYTSTTPLLHTLAHSVCPTSLNSSSSRTWSPLISALSKKSTMVSSNTSSYTSACVGETESQGPLPMHIPTQHSSKQASRKYYRA